MIVIGGAIDALLRTTYRQGAVVTWLCVAVMRDAYKQSVTGHPRPQYMVTYVRREGTVSKR